MVTLNKLNLIKELDPLYRVSQVRAIQGKLSKTTINSLLKHVKKIRKEWNR